MRPRPPDPPMGNVWDDITDAVGDAWGATGGAALDAVWDVTTSVWDRIPGSDAIGEAFKTLTAPIRELAQTEIGMGVLTLITGSYAAAGLLRGDRFDEAWLYDTGERLKLVVENYSGGAGGIALDAAGKLAPGALEEIKAGIDKASHIADWAIGQTGYPDLETALAQSGADARAYLAQIGLTPETLAEQAGIRPDFAAQILNNRARQLLYPMSDFVPSTGVRRSIAIASAASDWKRSEQAALFGAAALMRQLDDQWAAERAAAAHAAVTGLAARSRDSFTHAAAGASDAAVTGLAKSLGIDWTPPAPVAVRLESESHAAPIVAVGAGALLLAAVLLL